MSHNGRGRPPSNRGRGGGRFSSNRGRGTVISQIGNKQLIAANIASSSSSNNIGKDDKLFQEFLEFKAKQGNTDSSQPSFANIVKENDETDDVPFYKNGHKDLILILEDKDLKWKGEIWHLMQRYLDTASFTFGSYKQRSHFENILKATGSCEFSHFYAGNQKAYSFSKVIIKQIISAEDWGISTLKEREYYLSEQKTNIKFNFWDYMEAFNKAFLYQNTFKKHTWFFKICPLVYNKEIPNWFHKWWQSYGPSNKILPEPYYELYSEWLKVSPTLIELEHENKWIDGLPSLHFFSEFGIPWILKWEPEVGYTQENLPCINRTFYTKFWKKMLRKNELGEIEGQETIEIIEQKILTYKKQIELKQQRESPSPFQHISRKLLIQKGQMSREEFLQSYMEEVKKDLIKNLEKDNSDISMTTASNHDEEEDEDYIGAQDPYADETDISIEELLKTTKEQIIGSQKGKEKMNQDK